ncbi:cuticle collagen 7-like [Nycticebus coucang]|uniref:cuticle collagen 7-like n=1 Tax=Nycticebus coucang TaxID=9470 RepID=UPI00234C685B|nr:cuticle collagen 7-like [Nycticebus coucang]
MRWQRRRRRRRLGRSAGPATAGAARLLTCRPVRAPARGGGRGARGPGRGAVRVAPRLRSPGPSASGSLPPPRSSPQPPPPSPGQSGSGEGPSQQLWLKPAEMGASLAPTHRANLQSDPGKPKAPVWPPLISSS